MRHNYLRIFVYLSFLCIAYISIGYRDFLELPVAIILITYLFYRNKWRSYLGLDFSLKNFIYFLILLPLLQLFFYKLILISIPLGLTIREFIFRNQLFSFGQCLSEELVFRALLLNILIIKNYNFKKTLIAIVLYSLAFSVLHWVFNLYFFHYKGELNLSALATIFFFGASISLIYIETKNIFLPLAIHYGWNSIRFGCAFIDRKNPEMRFPEYITFNFLEGSNIILIFSFISFLFTLGISIYRRRCRFRTDIKHNKDLQDF